jgi:hypothetical protein
MRTFLISIIILFGGIALLIHSYKMPPTTEVVVLRDVTQKFTAVPDVNEILSQFHSAESDKWNGAKFRFLEISDVSYNQVKQAEIEAGNKWLLNQQDRDKSISKFESDLTRIIADSESEIIGRNYSSVYLPIAMELNKLSLSKSQKRLLVIYSDLMEHDQDISLYARNEFRLLQTNPEKLNATLLKRQYLMDLTGIEVYIIYQPSDNMNDKEFIIVSDFYKRMLEQMGAKVMIRANL